MSLGRWNRYLVSVLVLVIGIMVVGGVACGKDKLKLYLMSLHKYPDVDAVVAEVAKKYNLDPEIEYLGIGDMRVRLTADFAAGVVPDVVEGLPGWVPEFAAQGLIQDITQEVNSWGEFDDFFKGAQEGGMYDGRVFALRMYYNSNVMLQNKKLFEEAGLDPEKPPTTWKELLDYTQTMTRDTNGDGKIDRFGYIIQGTSTGTLNTFTTWLSTAGTEFVDQKKKEINLLDTLETVDCAKFLQELKKHSFVSDPAVAYDYARQLFITNENIAMVMSGAWDIGNVRKTNPDLESRLGVFYVPAPDKKRADAGKFRSMTTGTVFFIPSESKSPEVAWELMKRLTDKDLQVVLSQKHGIQFSRKSWAEDPRTKALPLISKFAKLLGVAELQFAVRVAHLGAPKAKGRILGELWPQVYERIIYREEDPRAVFENFIRESNALIKREIGN